MAETDTEHSMTTCQHGDAQAQAQEREPKTEETDPQAKRDQWGQDLWVMRWGC
jgi:hypothetical protein